MWKTASEASRKNDLRELPEAEYEFDICIFKRGLN